MPLKTADNNFGTAKWIVSGAYSDGCTHITIASALTSASSGDTIFIRPGTYTENLTLKAGVNLAAYSCDAITPNVKIKGKLTATFTGTASLSGLLLETNGSYLIESTGSSSTTLNIKDCFLNMVDFSGIHSTNSNFNLSIYRTEGDKATTGIKLISMSAGAINLYYSNIENSGNSVTPEDISGGTLGARHSTIGNGVLCTSTGSINFHFCDFTCPSGLIPLDTSSSSICVLYFCNLPVGGGVAAVNITGSGAVRMWGANNIESSAANSITGSGALTYDLLTSGNVLNTLSGSLTITARRIYTGSIDLGNNLQIRSGSGAPSNSAPKGTLYLRTDGTGSTNRAYINTNGSTTWTAINTVA